MVCSSVHSISSKPLQGGLQRCQRPFVPARLAWADASMLRLVRPAVSALDCARAIMRTGTWSMCARTFAFSGRARCPLPPTTATVGAPALPNPHARLWSLCALRGLAGWRWGGGTCGFWISGQEAAGRARRGRGRGRRGALVDDSSLDGSWGARHARSSRRRNPISPAATGGFGQARARAARGRARRSVSALVDWSSQPDRPGADASPCKTHQEPRGFGRSGDRACSTAAAALDAGTNRL